MKKLYLISFAIIILFSCLQEETPKPNIPDWFLPQIKELENSGECFGCNISQIVYNSNKYYHLYCGYWSCMYCYLYDSNGNLVKWETEEFNNFLKNKKNESVIWKCGDKLN